jgi:hypothetical protein
VNRLEESPEAVNEVVAELAEPIEIPEPPVVQAQE